MRESHRPTLPRGLGSKIILPTLLVIVMFAFPVLLAWQGMLSIQSENESMRGYSQSLVDLHEVQAGLQAEAAASLNADAQNTVRTVILAMVLTGLLGLGLAELLTRRMGAAIPSPWLLFWTIRAVRKVGWPYYMT